MLTTQSATPDAALRPFIQWYVQRNSKAGEVIEPVFPRAGTMLIFQFETPYEVKEYETEQLRRTWAATVIGPIVSRRTRLILRDHVHSLDVLFRPLGCTDCLVCRSRRSLEAGLRDTQSLGRRSHLFMSASGMR